MPSERLRRRPADAERLEWARNVIERQVDQLTRLVDDLLDVSRITRGKIELDSGAGGASTLSCRAPSTRPGR